MVRAGGPRNLIAMIVELDEAIQSGQSLSAAMSACPSVISNVAVSLIESAERDGSLAQAFQDIARLSNQELTNKARLQNALLYPLVLSVVVGLTLAFMLLVLAPSIKSLVLSAGIKPSVVSELLFWLAEKGAGVLPIIVVLFVVFFLFFWLARVSVVARLQWHRVLLRMWWIGPVHRDLNYSRLCHICSRLFASGLDIDKTLEIASRAIDNSVIHQDIQRIRQRLSVGNSFHQSLEGLPTLPLTLAPLVCAAEASGEMATALHHAAEQLEHQANDRLIRFTTVVPPLLVCGLGLLLLGLVIGLLGPLMGSAMSMDAGL
jgi:type II secretory pathway component PulF